MNYPTLIRIGIITLLALAILSAGCTQTSPSPPVKTSPATANPPASTSTPANPSWSFVVMGDSIDSNLDSATGVSPALPAIAAAAAAEKADLVVYTGDLINGGDLSRKSPVADNYSAQFGNWMAAVSPVYNYTTGNGIPLYVVRGNHENGPPGNATQLLAAYRATVATGMPVNGPPGEDHLTYSFTHKGAKFIINDEYIPHNGLEETVNQSWVNGELTTDTRPFMFVFGHSPAYLVDIDPDELPSSMPVHPKERDIFWASLVQNHVTAYICSHVHLYIRAESQGVPQIVSGNAGAPMLAYSTVTADPVLKIKYPLQNISAQDQKMGYLVVTVNETLGTWSGVQKMLDASNGTWTTGDTFTLPARSNP